MYLQLTLALLFVENVNQSCYEKLSPLSAYFVHNTKRIELS